jgi:hypothetical protein
MEQPCWSPVTAPTAGPRSTRRPTDLGLAAETVASRKELSAVIIDGIRDSRVFSGWRHQIVGERLLQLL